MSQISVLYNILCMLLVIIAVIVVDQICKYYIYVRFANLIQDIELLPFLRLTLVWNYGVSFGMFNEANQNQLMFIVLSVLIVVALLVWHVKNGSSAAYYPLGLIIGGAVGNNIDRLHYGAVLDFIDLHILNYHYPAFNIADGAIVVGAVLLICMHNRNEQP